MNGLNSPRLAGKKFLPGIAWFFLVTALLCLPGSDIPTPENWMNKIYIDKWVHVGLFAVLAFLFMRPVIQSSWELKEKWRYCIKIAIAASLWGLTSEVIQKFYIAGRSFDLFDWSSDTLGALIALIYCKKRFLKTV